MKFSKKILSGVILTAFAASLYGAYRWGVERGMQRTPAQAISVANAKRILYWHDPMVPGHRFDKPGKSPFMDMDLVPVYADADIDTEAGSASHAVRIDPRIQQNLGMRTALVSQGQLTPSMSVVGNVSYDEHAVTVLQARATAYVERLLVRAPLEPVRKGQALAELYVPDWIAAQEDYLAVRHMANPAPEALAAASLQRMRLLGMPEEQIDFIETTGQLQPRVIIRAPNDGIVSELAIRQGMTVMNGAPLLRLNGVANVWINAELPENLSAQIRPGMAVNAQSAALPGKIFHGTVNALLPEVNANTRTLKARIALANPQRLLSPGMFMQVDLQLKQRPATLLIPSEAIIHTGKRKLVMVALEDGKFTPVEITTGSEAQGKTEVISGLSAGQKVVVSGQFLIDSEASLKSLPAQAVSATPPATP